MAFPIYFLALSVSTAGVPVAISIITAEHVAIKDIVGAKRVFRISMGFMFCTGLLFSILTYLSAHWLIEYEIVRDPRAYYSIVALAPAIFFVTLLAASRGYLQGYQRMTPTAVSQIVEQIFRVITMVIFAQILLPWGLQFAAAGASLGALAGAIMGVLTLIYFHYRLERDIPTIYGPDYKLSSPIKVDSIWRIIKRIFQLALPISATSIMLPIVANIDLMIVPARLEVAGYSVNQATELFGYLTGMAVPLVNLATIFTASICVSIVPAISRSRALNNVEQCFNLTSTAMRLSNFICFPAFIIVLVLAVPISTLIYNAPGAGDAVWVSSFSIVLLGLHQVSTGVLQGLGKPNIPMYTMIAAAVAKVFLNYTLTAQPSLGIMGAAWATVADIGLAAIINIYIIYRLIKYKVDIWQISKTIFASIIMALILHYSYNFLILESASNAMAIFSSMLLSSIIYVIILIKIGGIMEEDLARMPMIGSKIVLISQKLGLIKK